MSPPSTPSRRPPSPSEATTPPEPIPSTFLVNSAFLLEIAWEVCNQVGGIYQVIRSKAPLMVERWAGRYCLIGPYVPGAAQLEFEPTPPSGWLAKVVAAVEASGLKVHHGHWLIQGKPRVLLVEHTAFAGSIGELKYQLWERVHIDSATGNPVIDGAVTFGEGVRRVLAAAAANLGVSGDDGGITPERLLAHFHEWQGGVALPMVRNEGLPVSTVFTTHATLLGRYIASNEDGFYDRLGSIDDDAAAARYNVRTQHAIERACAHGAHVFTTVSQITAEECGALLGRVPDVVTPNGLTISRYSVGHDFQTFHADFKERIHAFTRGYFFPHHHFDLDKTLYMFNSGRFEPRNKGFDLCLEAMARLNAELKAARLGVTVVFFIITSRPARSINPLVLEKRGVLNELEKVCEQLVEDVGQALFRRASTGEPLALDELVDEYWELRYRRTQAAFRMKSLPPVITHILEDDQQDPVLNHIRQLRLFNLPEDPVKVVYHPEFISPVSPLWGIEYDQFVRGCHLGLFPSSYEPWGYTPLECMALGTPAISSDLAGFGRYVIETQPNHEQWGMSVLPRRGRNFHDAAAELARRLFAYCLHTRRERVTLRTEVEKRSWDFDWSQLGAWYHAAHELALARGEQDLY